MDDDPHVRGELGRAIMEVLAAAAGPLTPAQVRTALGVDRAYTTVMTVLARLAERGVLERHRVGRGYAYTAQPERAEVTARQMHRLLEAGEDRQAVLARFVHRLSADDEQTLTRLLAEISARSGSDATARP